MEVDSVTIHRLQELKGGPLLPNLQSICWTVRDIHGASFDGLRCLLMPTLSSLELVCERDEGGQLPKNLMTAVSENCPYLQRLHLKAPFNVLDTETLSLVLHDFGSLQQLALDINDNDQRHGRSSTYPVTSSLLSQLAAFSNLSELRLTKGSFYTREQDVVGPFKFSSVKVLHLYLDAITSSAALWEDCEFPFLRELSIEYGMPSSYSAPLELLSRITANVSHDTLQSLTLRESRIAWMPVYLPSQDGMVDASPLHSLFVFRNLRHLAFEIASTPGVPLTDTDLQAFACAWPHLRTLQTLNNSKTVTYRGNSTLIHLCSDLDELSINIAPIPALNLDDLTGLPTSEHRVMLGFRNSSVGDIASTVLWLARTFPNVSPEERYDSVWKRRRTVLSPSWRKVFAMAEKKRNGELVDDTKSLWPDFATSIAPPDSQIHQAVGDA